MSTQKVKDEISLNPINQEEISTYLKDIRKLKVMTPEREKELAKRNPESVSECRDILDGIVDNITQHYEMIDIVNENKKNQKRCETILKIVK